MRSAAVLVLKSAVLSVIFCVIAATALLLLFSFSNSITRSGPRAATAAQTQHTEWAALMKKSWAQAAELDAMQQSQKTQFAESAALLKKQAELLNRWDAVIQRWEKIPAK